MQILLEIDGLSDTNNMGSLPKTALHYNQKELILSDSLLLSRKISDVTNMYIQKFKPQDTYRTSQILWPTVKFRAKTGDNPRTGNYEVLPRSKICGKNFDID